MNDLDALEQAARAGKPHCICKPPSGVTRNHDKGCPLFDVDAAYGQGYAAAVRDAHALREERWNTALRHAEHDHYAREANCGDPGCLLNWSRRAALSATEPAE